MILAQRLCNTDLIENNEDFSEHLPNSQVK